MKNYAIRCNLNNDKFHGGFYKVIKFALPLLFLFLLSQSSLRADDWIQTTFTPTDGTYVNTMPVTGTGYDDVTMAISGTYQWRTFTLSGPGTRIGINLRYCPERATSVFFGGMDWSGTKKNDVWEWNGTSWNQITITGTAPSVRMKYAWEYNRERKVFVLFGGTTTHTNYMNDTWDLSIDQNGNGTWTQITSNPKPSGRWNPAMCYDPDRNKIVMFGGRTGAGTMENDVWEYDTSWVQTRPSDASQPYRRHMANSGMAYDTVNDILITCGGFTTTSSSDLSMKDVWQYNYGQAVSFTQKADMLRRLWGNGVVFDKTRGVFFNAGGFTEYTVGRPSYSDDTYNYLTDTWTNVGNNSGAATYQYFGITYDETRRKVVCFSSYNSSGALAEYGTYFKTSGSYTSANIQPANLTSWGILNYSVSTTTDSACTIDVVTNEITPTVIISNVPSGADLSISLSGITAIKLMANFAITNTITSTWKASPTLHEWSIIGYQVDTTPPAGSIVINDGDAYVPVTSVTITLNITDNESGLVQMQFSNNGSAWSGWESYNAVKAWTLESGDGSKTVYAQVKNGAGLVGDFNDTIILDTTTPTAFSLITPTNAALVFTTRPTFGWKTASDTNPVTYTLYVDSGASLIKELTGISYTLTAAEALAPYQNHTWNVKATDAAGNYVWAVPESYWQFYVQSYSHTLGTVRTALDAKEPGESTVDYASGNLNIDVGITHIVPSTDLPTNITFYYNSLDPITSTPLGPNWTHTFNQSVITGYSASGVLIHRQFDGRQVYYSTSDSTNYYPRPEYGEFSGISATGGTYVLTNKDRSVYTFNTYGQLINIEDTNSNTITCTYTSNLLTDITLPNGQAMTITYSGGLIDTITDPAGNVTDLTYDSGRLWQIIQDTGAWRWTFGYQSGTNLINSVTNPEYTTYGATGYQYDSNNLLTSIAIGGTTWKTFEYDEANAQVVITDGEDNPRTVNYNLALDAWTDSTDASSNVTQNEFDYYRNLLSRTDANSNTTEYDYDASRGNVLTRTDAASNVTTYVYGDSVNPDLPTTITDAAGIITSYTYDSAGNLTQIVNAYGTGDEQTTDYTYYADGSLDTMTSPIGVVTDYDYTNGYMTKKTVDSAGVNIVYEYAYTTLGYLDKAYDPRWTDKSVYTDYDYDYRGNCTQITKPIDSGVSVVTLYDYNKLDKIFRKEEDYGGKGIVTYYYYGTRMQLTSMVVDQGGLGLTTSYEYWNDGRLKKVTDPVGATTEYVYEANGWLDYTKQQVRTSDYAYTYYAYDNNGNLTGITDPLSHVTEYTYTSLNQLASTIDPEDYVITYAYNNVGLMTSSRDARNKTTSYSYDDLRRLDTVTTPENIKVTYHYDAADRVTQVDNPYTGSASDVTTYGYDNADRVVTSTVNSHPSSQFFYDKMSNLTGTIDPEGDGISYTYNYAGWRTQKAINPSGLNIRTGYGYDKLGRTTAITRAYGTGLATETVSIYDNASRVITSYTGSITYATTYEYNARGQRTRVIDANGNDTEYEYEKGGWLKRTTDALGFYTDYEYNLDGQQTEMTYYRSTTPGSNPVEITYAYYDNHLLYTKTEPGFDGSSITYYYYDGNGNLTSKQDPNADTTSYAYDNNNRLTTKTYQDSSYVSYTYDAAGNVLTIVSSDGNTDIENDYDDMNRLIAVTDNTFSTPKVIEYSYNEDGTRSAMSVTGLSAITYAYDAAKRLQTVTQNSVTEADYDYNALGQRTKLTLGNGSYTDYGYDSVTGWLTIITNTTSTNTVLSSFAYTRDYVGNKKTMTYSYGDVVTYTYSAVYQLTEEERTGYEAYVITNTYDGVGNKLTYYNDGSLVYNYDYNNANQTISCTKVSGGGSGTTIFAYDANGSMISETRGANTNLYTYDYENRMTVSNFPGTVSDTDFAYNALGRRIDNHNIDHIALKGVEILVLTRHICSSHFIPRSGAGDGYWS